MKIKFFLICIFMIITGFSLPAQELCGRSGGVYVANGEYMIRNNVLGPTNAAQCINVEGSSFTVTTSEHNNPGSGSPASYPCIYKGCYEWYCTSYPNMSIRINDIKDIITTWSTGLDSTGIWNATSEALFMAHPSYPSSRNDIMMKIWIDQSGDIQPVGSMVGTVNIGGFIWEVWYTDKGRNTITYRLTPPRNVINLDYKSFIDDSVLRGYIPSIWYLVYIKAGFEIWNGGTGLMLKSFQCSVNKNLGDVDNNGTVDIIDALKIAQYYVGLDPSDFILYKADVDCNGSINILDALLVAQFYLGIITSFC